MTEKELQNKIIAYLKNWFIVYDEVESDCMKGRLDLLIYHKSDKSQLFPIGIELKKHDRKRGQDFYKLIAQARKYKRMTFRKIQVPIFICPQISEIYFVESNNYPDKIHNHRLFDRMNSMQNNVHTFVCSFGIGQTLKFNRNGKDYIHFAYHNCRIWCSLRNEFEVENYLKIKRLMYDVQPYI
jgi:hypothetical protein